MGRIRAGPDAARRPPAARVAAPLGGVPWALMQRLILFFLPLLAAAAADEAGSAAQGAKLFEEFRCRQCHAAQFARNLSPNGLASAMWNHTAAMSKAIEQARIPRRPMTARQAADLYAFLGGTGKSDPPGDAGQGERLYQAKLCAACHDDSISGAPALAGKGRVSAFSMMAGLWMHGGGMLSRMAAGNRSWQQLTPRELGHLAAFLNSRK